MKDFKNENCICLTSKVENAQLKKDHTQVCPICGKTFNGYGNNPYPIAKDGLCCDDCNMWVIVMRCWLYSNHDWLKGLVDGLPLNEIAVTGHSYINGESVAFTFYKDELTKNLDVVVVCDDECIEKVVEGALQNWIANNCSDLDINNVRVMSKVGVRRVSNEMKIEFELEAEQSA